MSPTAPLITKNKLEEHTLFKLSRFKELIKRTQPHRHEGYYELIILLEGAGFHWVDTELIPIAPPLAFFLSPGQVHCWQLTALPKGYVLLFRADFIGPLHNAELYALVQHLEQRREVPIPPDGPVPDLLAALEAEYRQPAPNPAVLRGLLQILLVRLMEIGTLPEPAPTNGEALFRRFADLLRSARPAADRRVAAFAQQLGVSPQYLNNVCRRVRGQAAGELITRHVLLDSKRYLLHTDLRVAEIADQLGFADASHFVRYFRRHCGQTPLAFRQTILARHLQVPDKN
jgi:AraC family transcriptional activator of pobA